LTAECTIEFLGENAEAIGHYSVRATRPHPLLVRRPHHLRTYCERQRDSNSWTDRVPWTLYIRTALLGGRWIGARALGRRAYPEYVDLRFCIGLIRGHRELQGALQTRSLQ
jgi:hypothetical protein